MPEFDRGPLARFGEHFSRVPDPPHKERFWFDWGPVFYRGRLSGTARLLCVGSDSGATERVVGRTLVGDAGQRVQGFLGKLGLTTSYLCLNAFAYSLIPSEANHAHEMLQDSHQMAWRNRLFDMARGPELRAVVGFGRIAQDAVELWPGKDSLSVFRVSHPTSRDEGRLLVEWRGAIAALRQVIQPDPDGTTNGPNYGTTFREEDYAPIPRRDLPFGVPPFSVTTRWAGGKSRLVGPP